MLKVWAVVLAAGEGRRMHSDLPKVLHKLCGKPMLAYILKSAVELTKEIVVVVGHGASLVRSEFGGYCQFVEQKEQLGTGHAVLQALDLLPDNGLVLVLCGDTPLIDSELLQNLLDCHAENAATVATTELAEPAGYGRVVRSEDGLFSHIVEDRDAKAEERSINEINTGTYCFDIALLKKYLPLLSADNEQGEYYLPDVLQLLVRGGYAVKVYPVQDCRVGLGINNRLQLSEASALLRERINRAHMLNGVTITDPASAYIDHDAQIGRDTLILPNCLIEGNAVIGEKCEIGPDAHLKDTVIGDGVKVFHSVLINVKINSGPVIGPFEYFSGKKA